MSEFRCSEMIVLCLPREGLSDGEVTYDEISVPAVIIESRGFAPVAGESADIEFLIPGDHAITPGCRILHGGQVYDVASVKYCRDLDGKLRAERCRVS